MNYVHPQVKTPVVRRPLLFHQSPKLPSSSYYPARPTSTLSAVSSYLPQPSLYSFQTITKVPTPLPSYPAYHRQPYLDYSRVQAPSALQLPISSYSYPALTNKESVSSKGLTLILIAILTLVALDLAIVRPQKH